jgi:hypothetical protein
MFGSQIECLTPHHAMKADGFGDDPDHVESLLCAQSFYFSEPLKGGGLQAIAGKNGGRLVEGAVQGRLTPPEVIIVHRREIIVHK